ncbi:hypothetical protein AB9K26_12065 [Psychroserpens sp. XS_ASV72]
MNRIIVHNAPKSLMFQWDYRGTSELVSIDKGRYVIVLNHF